MISKEQVADLRPGDVVEVVRRERFTIDEVTPDGRAYPWIGDGEDTDIESMTVMYRAPRPLYVNHDRTEPVPGDVARNTAGHLRVCQPSPYTDEPDPRWWGYGIEPYGVPGRWSHCTTHLFRDNGKSLRLLVDGETGQVVP